MSLGKVTCCAGYELLATGAGQRLERWNGIVVQRPESAADWPWKNPELPTWQGFYDGRRAMGGRWHWLTPLPDPCIVRHGSLSFLIRETGSKHLGLFPEQAANWDWIHQIISNSIKRPNPIKVLNLFGYTGGSTLAAASAGAHVTHVDSARAMVDWCSENARLSGLKSAPIRYIVEDAVKYLQREIRRGNRYDAVIMDPPSFGRGKGGELWKLIEQLPELINSAHQALTDSPLFMLLNTYSDLTQDPRLLISMSLGGHCDEVSLGLCGSLDQQWIPCGKSYRWEK